MILEIKLKIIPKNTRDVKNSDENDLNDAIDKLLGSLQLKTKTEYICLNQG